MDKYFSGPVAYYALSCPMCGGTRIHLNHPLQANGTIEGLPAIVDFVNVGDNIVGLSSKMLFLMNKDLELIGKSAIDQVSCSNL